MAVNLEARVQQFYVEIQDTQDDLSSVNTQLRNTNSDIQATNRERVALQMEGLIPVPAEAGE